MTRLRTILGSLFALTVLATTQVAAAQSGDFDEGVDLLKRGRKDEALSAFQRALAGNPSAQSAYDLWKSNDEDFWRDMMMEGGEYELIAKRVFSLARTGRKERQNDGDAIKTLLKSLRENDDALERRRTIRALSADHGEYAVPFMARALGDRSDDDWRIVVMHALSQMDTAVVPPLLELTGAEDAFVRRNAAHVLGLIGDPRAAGVLTAMATSDPDGGVVSAASEAASRCGSTGNALEHLLKDGDDYHHRRSTVLRPHEYSDVVWSLEGDQLTSRNVPRAIYNNEMSRRSYVRALSVQPGSLEALAGVARASIDIESKLKALAESGEDVEDLLEVAAENSLGVSAAGIDALDLALQWSVVTDDAATGVRLCSALGSLATAPTPGLLAALDSGDGGMRGEAAVALGHVAASGGQGAGLDVVTALGESAGREIVRIAAIIDGDQARSNAYAGAMIGKGVHVNQRGTGASGLTLLHRIPGLDIILVGDRLPDMTVDQVIAAIGSNTTTAETPIFLLTGDEEIADLYSDRTAGSLTGAGDLSAVEEVFTGNISGDRAQADALARRAAATLAALASGGNTDLSAALGGLASTLSGRPDEVTIPAMRALAAAGNQNQVDALVAVAADSERSDEARIAAADALRGIFGRNIVAGSQSGDLRAILSSDASLAVRQATARAIGRMQLGASDRASIVRGVK